MMIELSILSRQQAQALLKRGFPEHAAVISFSDPDTGTASGSEVDYSGADCEVFRVRVRDIDNTVLKIYGLTYETYLPEADALARFVRRAVAEGRPVICQCEYGQSRSAACAAAILEFYEHRGIEIFADYRYYPNQVVYHKILEALERTGVSGRTE